MISPRIDAKGTHYYSDGSGRDGYIGYLFSNVRINSGGMHVGSAASDFKNSYYHTLRAWNSQNYKTHTNWTLAGRKKRIPGLLLDPLTARRINESKRATNYVHMMVRRLSQPKRINPFNGLVMGSNIKFTRKQPTISNSKAS